MLLVFLRTLSSFRQPNRAVGAAQGQDRQATSWMLLAAVLCFAALATPFFLGQVYVADDLGEFHLPLRNFYAGQLQRGESFDWMSSLYGGFYISGEGQLGAYHPLHFLLYRWLPLGSAFDLELLLNYPFMFLGTFVWLRRLTGRSAPAALGALVFTFCPFNLLHFVHPNAIAVVAHIPWLLLALDVAISGQTRQARATATLAISLLTGSQLLLGYPQYVWFSFIAEFAYVVWRASSWRADWRKLSWIALAKLLGMVLGAAQLLPTVDALAESVRSQSDAAFSNTGSLHPLNLLQLVAPYLFATRVVGQNTHELGLYLGAVPLLLCVWLVANHGHWGRYRNLARAVLVFAGITLLLAAGEFGPLSRLQQFLPLVNRFRFPCRAIVLFQLSCAVLSTIALVLLIERDKHPTTPNRRAWLPFVWALLASVGAAVVGPRVWPEHVAAGWLIWSGPALLAIATVLLLLVQRGTRGALAALALFAAVDLATYGLSYSVYGRTASMHDFVAGAATPHQGHAARVAAPDSTDGLRTGNRMLLAGVCRVDGYAGLEPAKRLDYRDPDVLRRAAAEWILVRSGDTGRATWQPLAAPAVRAHLVNRLRVREEGAKSADYVPGFATVAKYVEIPPALPGSARVLVDRPGHLVVETDTPTRQLLVTTESFHSGWRLVGQGQPGPVVRVDGDFLGCFVEPGRQRVELEFQPPGVPLGRWLSGSGLGLVIGVFCLRLCSWRRKPRLEST